mgnify:FL=1
MLKTLALEHGEQSLRQKERILYQSVRIPSLSCEDCEDRLGGNTPSQAFLIQYVILKTKHSRLI